mgnify:CR=1 FL=1
MVRIMCMVQGINLVVMMKTMPVEMAVIIMVRAAMRVVVVLAVALVYQ